MADDRETRDALERAQSEARTLKARLADADDAARSEQAAQLALKELEAQARQLTQALPQLRELAEATWVQSLQARFEGNEAYPRRSWATAGRFGAALAAAAVGVTLGDRIAQWLWSGGSVPSVAWVMTVSASALLGRELFALGAALGRPDRED